MELKELCWWISKVLTGPGRARLCNSRGTGQDSESSSPQSPGSGDGTLYLQCKLDRNKFKRVDDRRANGSLGASEILRSSLENMERARQGLPLKADEDYEENVLCLCKHSVLFITFSYVNHIKLQQG